MSDQSYLSTPLRYFWLANPNELPVGDGGHRNKPTRQQPDWRLAAALAVEVYESRLGWDPGDDDPPPIPPDVLDRAATPDTRELVASLLGARWREGTAQVHGGEQIVGDLGKTMLNGGNHRTRALRDHGVELVPVQSLIVVSALEYSPDSSPGEVAAVTAELTALAAAWAAADSAARSRNTAFLDVLADQCGRFGIR